MTRRAPLVVGSRAPVLERIADLTWRRPKLVLALVGAFVVLRRAVGHDVESHLKAAGFADSASESERATALAARRARLRRQPGHRAPRARAKDGGRLDLRSPAVRREVARIAGQLDEAEHVGRVRRPAARPAPAARALIARDGRSVVHRRPPLDPGRRGRGRGSRRGRQRRLIASELAATCRSAGSPPSFNEVNDQTREDLTKAELIAFPMLAILLLLVFRGVVAAAIPLLIGVLSILGTFLALRVMSPFVDTSLFALNITTAHEPRAGGRLRAAARLALPGGDRARGRDAGGAPPDRDAPPAAPSCSPGFTVAAAMAALGPPAAALPLLDRRRRRRGRRCSRR